MAEPDSQPAGELVVQNGKRKGTRLPLRPVTSIGAAAGSDIRLSGEGVMPVRRFASFSRYSMPKTESLLPIASASSWVENGRMRAKACWAITRVASPLPAKRGSTCSRAKIKSGRLAGAYCTSRSTVLRKAPAWPRRLS